MTGNTDHEAIILMLYDYYSHTDPTVEDGLEDVAVDAKGVMTTPKFARLVRESGLISSADDEKQAPIFELNSLASTRNLTAC